MVGYLFRLQENWDLKSGTFPKEMVYPFSNLPDGGVWKIKSLLYANNHIQHRAQTIAINAELAPPPSVVAKTQVHSVNKTYMEPFPILKHYRLDP
jgi:hypothetical protein